MCASFISKMFQKGFKMAFLVEMIQKKTFSNIMDLEVMYIAVQYKHVKYQDTLIKQSPVLYPLLLSNTYPVVHYSSQHHD